jgi:hypothetical protein
MTIDQSIFGIRFGSSDELYPSKEELAEFLETPNPEGGLLHQNDLQAYQTLFSSLIAFEKQQRQGSEAVDYRERMFYAVLRHTCFLNQILQSTVEQYKYHVHSLRQLDFRKPTAFIKAAEEEMKGFDHHRKEDAVKLARLQELTDERKQVIEKLTRQWMAIAEELSSILSYIRENLERIIILCTVSIDILRNEQMLHGIGDRLGNDVKAQFRDQLKDALHRGPLTQQYIDTVKRDVDTLIAEMSALQRKDAEAMKKLYQSVLDHVKRVVSGLDALAVKRRSRTGRVFEEERELFSHGEKILVSLVSDFRFEMHAPVTRSATSYLPMLSEKRNEFLDFLVEHVRKDRRSLSDRRVHGDRRKFKDPEYRGSERRKGNDRRKQSTRRRH